MASKAVKSAPLSKGQRWFVKISGSMVVLSVEIIDITECTVVLMEAGNFDLVARYKLSDVEFIERIIATPQQIIAPEQTRRIR